MNLSDLFSKRTDEALQLAVATAVKKKQRAVDTEHLLYALSKDDIVVMKVLKNLGIDVNELQELLEKQMVEGTFEGQNPAITPRSQQALQLAYQEAIELNHNYIGTEHLLLGLILENEGIAAQILSKYAITHQAARQAVIKVVGEGDKEGSSINGQNDTPTLTEFTKDLTQLAKENKIDPVIGRDSEISRVIEILARRKKNNPVLIGEPGVGKTAIAEGLAHRIINNQVPDILSGKKLLSLDLTAMVAGSKFRGEFEERAKKLIDELQKVERQIILFIDELHTIVGSGAQQGELDFSNIIKPPLARGDLQVIGATTLNEYQKYIEKDAALERRFQPVTVNEPTVEQTILILKGLKDRYEAHHKLKISDESLESAAKLSARYIKNRFLPDKAIDIVDEAASRVKIRTTNEPEELRNFKLQIEKLERERDSLTRANQHKESAELKVQIEKLKEEMKPYEASWQRQKGTGSPEVKVKDITEVISGMTGIPITELNQEQKESLLNLEDELHKRVIGQDDAIKLVSNSIRRSRTGLKDPKRPIASFLFLGPTGVGKTELAKALAELLFLDEEAIIRLDMSEYMDKFSVTRMIGSPPGYVGYDEGGQLTEQVRRRPYSIVLLDELEKAHPDVLNILLQILDDGKLTDGKGRIVDFKNTIIISTSNVGSELIIAAIGAKQVSSMLDTIRNVDSKKGLIKLKKAEDQVPEWEQVKTEVFKMLQNNMRPELINRFDEIIIFKALTLKEIGKIVELQLKNTKKYLKEQNIEIDFDISVIEEIARIGFDARYGARPIKRAVQREVDNFLSDEILKNNLKSGDKVNLSFTNGKFVIADS